MFRQGDTPIRTAVESSPISSTHMSNVFGNRSTSGGSNLETCIVDMRDFRILIIAEADLLCCGKSIYCAMIRYRHGGITVIRIWTHPVGQHGPTCKLVLWGHSCVG
jgi:hypothetical protein